MGYSAGCRSFSGAAGRQIKAKSAVKYFLTVNLIIFILMAAFNSCVKQEQESEKPLTITEGILSVGIEIGYPPMEYYDTDGITPVGFDIELVNALAEKLGLQVNFIDTAWEGILAGLNANRFDIAVNITILPGREERYNFTKPYINTSIAVAALKDSAVKLEKLEDIAGKRVGYQGGTTAQYFTEGLRENGIVFTSFSYDKIINCFDELALKRIDFIVADNIAAFDYANRQNQTVRAGKASPGFEVVWQGPADENIGIALKKKNDRLTLALNNALDELFEDGTIQEISQRIFNINIYSPLEN